MNDIDWFCDFFGFKPRLYEKMFMWISCHKEIHKAREMICGLNEQDKS